jgi:hypothetical protein
MIGFVKRSVRYGVLPSFALIFLCCFLPALAVPGREHEPVVLTGDLVPGLTGQPVERIAAFHREGALWIQSPIQVDEQAMVDLRQVANLPLPRFGS